MKKMQKVSQFCGKSLACIGKSSPTILTIIGATGVILSIITAVKATPKAMRLIDHAKYVKTIPEPDNFSQDFTTTDYVKTVWKCYIPTAVIAGSTIACILGANILNKHQQAVITSAYVFIDNAFREYKDKIKELYGEEVNIKAREELVKEKYNSEEHQMLGENLLFYEEYYDSYFERTREEVIDAEAKLNKTFAENGFATLNMFYEFLHLEPKSIGDFLGWSYMRGSELYGYSWIEFDHKLVVQNDGLECTIIGFPCSPPTLDYLSTAMSNGYSDDDDSYGRHGRF